MAAKRELSSTLRNLKFMQRAAVAQKAVGEKAEVEAAVAATTVAASGGAGSSVTVARKCIVIMEGNPQPGAVKGRMSFQNFNPSIDKLSEDAENGHQPQSASPSNYHQDSANASRMDRGSSTRFRDSNVASSESISPNELKRKQPELGTETPPSHKLSKGAGQSADAESSQSNGRRSHKPNKREKLDWNLLRPPKAK